MWWDQIAKGWKRIFVIVASPRTAAEVDAGRDASIGADALYSAGYEAAPAPPYTPDNRVERNGFSQHLSC